jgi:diguanylate cyclase (GGDEF)-like protein
MEQAGEANPVTVALLELDGSGDADSTPDGSADHRLLNGISNILRQSLTADHTAARFSDQQFLIVVPHEDVNQASRRTEEMRQRVDSTEFVVDGRSIKATVTCALTQIAKERSSDKLFEFLEEALTEAKRYGGNRTFTHDGNSPSPIVPPDLVVTPQQLAI